MKTPRPSPTPTTSAPPVPPVPARAVPPQLTPEQRVEQARREIGEILTRLGCEIRTSIQKRAFQPVGGVLIYADEVVLTIAPL